MSVKGALKKAASLWDKAKKKKPEFENNVTDGNYIGRLTKAELGESQKGRLQVAFAATVLKGEFKGETVRWWSGLKTEDNLMYLQRDLRRLGVEVPEDIGDLEEALEQLQKEKPKFSFRVKIDGEYLNVRIGKALEADDAGEDEDEDEDTEEEETEEEETDEEETEEEEDDEEEEDEEEESEDEDEESEEDEDEEESEEEEEEDSEEDDEEEKEEEDADEEEEDDKSEFEKGSRVVFKLKKKDVVGEIVKIDYKSEEAVVKTDDGKFAVAIEDLKPAPKTSVKKVKKSK